MSSSNKTPLGFNLWSGMDTPKREDFNADNLLADDLMSNVAIKDGTLQQNLNAQMLGFSTIEDINISLSSFLFTIPTSIWTESTAFEGWDYEASLTIQGITQVDLVRADFDMPSWLIAVEAQVAAAGVTDINTATFYAQTIPTADLTGLYTVNRRSE